MTRSPSSPRAPFIVWPSPSYSESPSEEDPPFSPSDEDPSPSDEDYEQPRYSPPEPKAPIAKEPVVVTRRIRPLKGDQQ